MRARSAVVAVIVVACCLPTSRALAWDGKRSGFILGFGAGVGTTWVDASVTTEAEGTIQSATTAMSVATDMRIGYAFNDRFALYFTHKMSLFDFDGLGENFEKVTDMHLLLQFIVLPFAVPFLPVLSSHNGFGAGVTWYLEPEAPSLFFDGGAGFMPFHTDARFLPGFGGYAGLGYELSGHVSVGCQVMFGMGKLTDGEADPDLGEPIHEYEGMALSGMLTLRVLGY